MAGAASRRADGPASRRAASRRAIRQGKKRAVSSRRPAGAFARRPGGAQGGRRRLAIRRMQSGHSPDRCGGRRAKNADPVTAAARARSVRAPS
ncbi:hypothetical protein E3O37_04045 [Burkholderia pseudomallei]|nr:hypothetical protein E3O37_04045 [Burkholderia pseudomallei]